MTWRPKTFVTVIIVSALFVPAIILYVMLENLALYILGKINDDEDE